MYVLHSFLLAVQKDLKGMARKAILHTAVAINSVIEEIVHCPVVLGSKITFFSPLHCTILPKLGGSANLSS